MEKVEYLVERVYSAAENLRLLKQKNLQLQVQYKKLIEENSFLKSENQQVRKLMAELDSLREERRLIRQKCERLLQNYEKANL